MKTPDPIIVCAAIFVEKNDGTVIKLLGARHWDSSMHELADAAGLQHKPRNFKELHQGFIDQFGTFYDRKQSLIIASRNNQIRFELDCGTKELFSEMLY